MTDTAIPIPDDAQAILDRQSEACKRLLRAAFEQATRDVEVGMKAARWVLENANVQD